MIDKTSVTVSQSTELQTTLYLEQTLLKDMMDNGRAPWPCGTPWLAKQPWPWAVSGMQVTMFSRYAEYAEYAAGCPLLGMGTPHITTD
jgi:hypothetical protein